MHLKLKSSGNNKQTLTDFGLVSFNPGDNKCLELVPICSWEDSCRGDGYLVVTSPFSLLAYIPAAMNSDAPLETLQLHPDFYILLEQIVFSTISNSASCWFSQFMFLFSKNKDSLKWKQLFCNSLWDLQELRFMKQFGDSGKNSVTKKEKADLLRHSFCVHVILLAKSM